MEYLDGVTLKHLIAAGTLDLERIISIAIDMLTHWMQLTSKASFIETSSPRICS